MEQISLCNLQATYACRLMVLQCTFITNEEKRRNLDYAIEVVDAPNKFCKVDFGDQKHSVNQIMYVDENRSINFEELPYKIPITYVQYKDMVEHVTIHCGMESASLVDEHTVTVLEKVADSDIDDPFAPANDEAF